MSEEGFSEFGGGGTPAVEDNKSGFVGEVEGRVEKVKRFIEGEGKGEYSYSDGCGEFG